MKNADLIRTLLFLPSLPGSGGEGANHRRRLLRSLFSGPTGGAILPRLFAAHLFLFSLSLLFSVSASLSAQGEKSRGEIVNRVLYVVGDIPITVMDIEMEMARIRSSRKPVRGSLRKVAVDRLMERAIVDLVAREESVIISDERVENTIQRRKDVMGIQDDARFRAAVERETGIAYDLWLDDLRYQIKKRSIIQIAVSVPQPEESEIEAFYHRNKARVGLEVKFREIILRPRSSSIQEEQRIAGLAREIHGKVRSDPSLFPRLARTTPDNISPLRSAGGLQAYLPISEVASRSQHIAGMLFNLSPGQISQVFRDRNNNYVLLKLEGKRPVPFYKVHDMIQQILYIQKEDESFDKWIEQKRKEISIIQYE